MFYLLYILLSPLPHLSKLHPLLKAMREAENFSTGKKKNFQAAHFWMGLQNTTTTSILFNIIVESRLLYIGNSVNVNKTFFL